MGGLLTIVEVPPFNRQAAVGMTNEELDAFKHFIAGNPEAGARISGTGGIRKVRWAVGDKGKSGGVRVIYYYHSDEIPLFLLSVYKKGRKESLSSNEKATLKKLVQYILTAYTGESHE